MEYGKKTFPKAAKGPVYCLKLNALEKTNRNRIVYELRKFTSNNNNINQRIL